MKISINGGIYFDPKSLRFPDWDDVYPPYRFLASTSETFAGYTLIRPHTLETEIPDDFDPRPGMVEALRKQRTEAEREFARRVMEIDQQINSLLAIEMA